MSDRQDDRGLQTRPTFKGRTVIYLEDGCEAGGPSCLECPLPACVLDTPFSIQRQKRDPRYREYVKARESGMTVEEVCRAFDVEERTVYRALAWAQKEVP